MVRDPRYGKRRSKLSTGVPDHSGICRQAEVKWLPFDEDVHMDPQPRRKRIQGGIVEVTLNEARTNERAIQWAVWTKGKPWQRMRTGLYGGSDVHSQLALDDRCGCASRNGFLQCLTQQRSRLAQRGGLGPSTPP